jgi:hypothetical protein
LDPWLLQIDWLPRNDARDLPGCRRHRWSVLRDRLGGHLLGLGLLLATPLRWI